MKRSEINAIIAQAKQCFAQANFKLPPFACWGPIEWREQYVAASEIRDVGMGWDITDFGEGDFAECGLVLFTLRNGRLDVGSKNYCEKIMLVQENQRTPMHFHWQKTEDIINRSGGKLVLELYQAGPDEELSDGTVHFQQDGISRSVEAGGKVVLSPGESITLTPYLYHTFYGMPGCGPVVVGEVSAVNDDANDNRFHQPLARFPEIEEDEEIVALIVSDYATLADEESA